MPRRNKRDYLELVADTNRTQIKQLENAMKRERELRRGWKPASERSTTKKHNHSNN